MLKRWNMQLQFAYIVTYAQGMSQLAAATPKEYNYGLNPGDHCQDMERWLYH